LLGVPAAARRTSSDDFFISGSQRGELAKGPALGRHLI